MTREKAKFDMSKKITILLIAVFGLQGCGLAPMFKIDKEPETTLVLGKSTPKEIRGSELGIPSIQRNEGDKTYFYYAQKNSKAKENMSWFMLKDRRTRLNICQKDLDHCKKEITSSSQEIYLTFENNILTSIKFK